MNRAPLRERRLKVVIKDLWNTGHVQFLPHAKKRMKERQFNLDDVKHVLWYGRLVEWSKPEETWRYKLEGHSVDGKKGAVVVEITAHLIIITVIHV